MTTREAVLARIREEAIIAIVRVPDPAALLPCAQALSAGGLHLIEFTLTVPGALAALPQARAALPADVILGIGTVLEAEAAHAAINAGAEFLVMPTLNEAAIRLSRRHGVPVLPGAFTPTEILQAWEWGGDLIKVFPAGVLGPGFFKDMRGPLPQIPLVAVGGVNLENTADYLRAGAVAVAVGSHLVDPALVKAGQWDAIIERARAFRAAVASARQ